MASTFGHPTRRGLLRNTAWLAALGAAGLDQPAFAQTGNFDWKRFKGQHIEVALVKGPRPDVLQRYQKEFEDLTGISVGSEQVPEQQLRQRNMIQFASGHPAIDVALLSLHVEKRVFGAAKWLMDLRPYLADPTLTSPDFAFDDFAAGGKLFSTQADGRIDTFPLSLDYAVLYWNKEMFAAKGVAYPKTLAEIADAAAALTDPAKQTYGFVARGMKNANTYVWACLMLGWGQDSVVDGKLNTTGPAAVQSAELFTKLMRNYAPPGVVGFNWNESQTSFMQGTAAMWIDSSGFAGPLEDPTHSRVVGKVGYGVIPAGPVAHAVGLTGDALGVAAASEHKGAAYFYIQWATAKLNEARFLQTGVGVGARDSILKDPTVLAAMTPATRAWAQCMQESAPLGHPCLPNIIPVTEFRDVFGIALTNMITGGDIAKELANATATFAPTLAKSELG
jgi:multiple sugar transport system substrate-binding protein